jgi:hypothetical protein
MDTGHPMVSTVSLLAAALAAGSIGAGWPVYPVAQAPAPLRPAIQRGDLIIVSLQSSVLRELNAAIRQGGVEHALKSCHIEAAAAALSVLRREGVSAGRTSARLRNPRNAPPPWAADIVARYDGNGGRDAGGFVVDLGDQVGLLRPIVAQPICAACHGTADDIPPAVKAAIDAHYPKDRAVNVRPGDLRGWFWVEIPKRTGALKRSAGRFP